MKIILPQDDERQVRRLIVELAHMGYGCIKSGEQTFTVKVEGREISLTSKEKQALSNAIDGVQFTP